MSSLTLEEASRIVDEALNTARTRKFEPLCVAVLDAGGHLLALKREDGAGTLRPEIACGKARGVLGMGMGGRELARRASDMPAFFNALVGLTGGNMVPVPGGVLVKDVNGAILGAVGISGDISDNDEVCAIAAVTAAGLEADPG